MSYQSTHAGQTIDDGITYGVQTTTVYGTANAMVRVKTTDTRDIAEVTTATLSSAGDILCESVATDAYNGTQGYINNGDSSSVDTINFSNGNYHLSTLTTNTTYTFTDPSSKAGPCTLKIVMGGSGGYSATLPGNCYFAGKSNVDTTPFGTGATIKLDFVYDDVNDEYDGIISYDVG